MSHERQRGGPPPSKPQSTPAISGAEVQSLKQRLEALEKLVKESFDEKNQWNSEVRQWVGKSVTIQLVSDTQVMGVLRWMDRYTLCVDEVQYEKRLGICIVHKGAVALIRLNTD